MSIIRTKKNNNFTTLDNRGLQDKNISWQAKGMLAYLLSLPDDWHVYVSELQNHALNGKDSTASILNELISAGYIRRNIRRDSGRFSGYNYTVYETGISPDTGNPDTGNPELLNTNLTNNEYKLKTNNIKAPPAVPHDIRSYNGEYTPDWLLGYINHYKKKLTGYIPPNISDKREALIAICDWLQYKRERKKKYTTSGFLLFLKRVFSITTPESLPGVVSESIGSGWADLIWERKKLSQIKLPTPRWKN